MNYYFGSALKFIFTSRQGLSSHAKAYINKATFSSVYTIHTTLLSNVRFYRQLMDWDLILFLVSIWVRVKILTQTPN